MLLSVGYPVIKVPWFKNVIKRYKNHIGEIYFAWGDMPSGRMPISREVQERMESDLDIISKFNIGLCLLINGNCYGKNALSQEFANKIKSTITTIQNKYGALAAITTTSPFVAYIIKDAFPLIEIRASINMRIGTIEGMEYLKESFDGFYVQREYNRNINHLSKLKEWADKNNKKLHCLLNSGCLNFCSNQTFHDNLVSHEAELIHNENIQSFAPVICHKFYSVKENRDNFEKTSNWIHPNKLNSYNNIFSTGKLATRMTTDLEKVLNAYTTNNFSGNMAELLEPRFDSLIKQPRN